MSYEESLNEYNIGMEDYQNGVGFDPVRHMSYVAGYMTAEEMDTPIY